MIFTEKKERAICKTEHSSFQGMYNFPHSPAKEQKRIKVEILKQMMPSVGIVKRTQVCTSSLHPKLINEKANPFSAGLRQLQDTLQQSDIKRAANDTSPALKHKAGLNRNNLYSPASFHILSCNKVVNKHCPGQALEEE